MTDRREQILERVLAILTAMPAVKLTMRNIVRNRGELPPDMRPAISLMDADEVARPPVVAGRGRLTAAPQLVDMTPLIYVVMDGRELENKLIGEDMNAMRMAILKAVMFDEPLAVILGSNGGRRYTGLQTDMALGQPMEGLMVLQMTFTYPLLPNEL